jgi:hypothetical protein
MERKSKILARKMRGNQVCCSKEAEVKAFTVYGITSDFAMLVNKPEAAAKMDIISIVTFKSFSVGLIKRDASSANRLTLKLSHSLESLESKPASVAFSKSLCRGSIAKRKSMGERESPYLTPRQ